MRKLDVAQAVAGAIAASRLARGARRPPPLAPRPGPVGTTVSVVIPARDEARRIGPCLAALATDDQVTQVIVVDDESSDGTAAAARAAGARVVAGAPLPPGWVGKPWALQQGLDHAAGEWVLALDADVRITPGLVGALLDEAAAQECQLLTAGVRFVCRTRPQRWLHASMLATLVYRFGPPGPRTELANGQCLLARRDWLARHGGFRVTGRHMTDDVALARWLTDTGARVGFVDGTRLASVEMHRTAPEVWREWGRSLPMADVTPAPRQAAELALIWLTMALPVLRLVAGRPTKLDLALLTARGALTVALRSAYEASIWPSPLADPLAAVRLTAGALHPVRTWRGRTYS